MASIALGTSNTAFLTAQGNSNKIARTSNGVLWAFHVEKSSTRVYIYGQYSLDDGATWAGKQRVNAEENNNGEGDFSVFIDQDDYCHIVWREAQSQYLAYRRGTPNAGRTAWTWGTQTNIYSGSFIYAPDLVAHREGTGWVVHVVGQYDSGAQGAVFYWRGTIASNGATTWSGVTQLSLTYGDVHCRPSIDFHHTGDGKTVKGGTPHVYIGWTAGKEGSGASDGMRFRQYVYSGGSWTLGADTLVSAYWAPWNFGWSRLLFDGTTIVLGGLWYGAASYRIVLYDISTGGAITKPVDVAVSAKPNYLVGGTLTYDGNGNVYMFGEWGNQSPFGLQYRKFNRSTLTLEAAVTLVSVSRSHNLVSAARAASTRVEWMYTDGAAAPYTAYFGDPLVLNAPPNAPGLVAPANGATIDLGGAVYTDWTFNDPDTGDTQGAWAFRRKLSGAASYEYWNVGTAAWQSTEVWNSGSATEYTFPAGSWANGNTYNWSVNTRDQSGATGAYAGDRTVSGGNPPDVTVDEPRGTATSSRPRVEWTFFDPAGGSQAAYHVKVFDADTYSAGGFDPNTTAALWDSGEINSSSVFDRVVGVDLETGATYRAYVRVKDNEGIYSGWMYRQFSVSLSPPNVPTIVVTDDPDNARVIIDVQGSDNVLGDNQSDLEVDTTGWAASNANTTISQSADRAWRGTRSLKMTSVAAGDIAARTDPTNGLPVVAGKTYSASAQIEGAMVSTRSAKLSIVWRDGANNVLSQVDSALVTTDTDGLIVTGSYWKQATVTAVAPANAAYATLVVTVLATGGANESHYIDGISLRPGSNPAWSPGGFASSTAFIVERSFDGGITWEPVRGTETGQVHDGLATQELRVIDREMGPGTTVTYRAKTTVEV